MIRLFFGCGRHQDCSFQQVFDQLLHHSIVSNFVNHQNQSQTSPVICDVNKFIECAKDANG